MQNSLYTVPGYINGVETYAVEAAEGYAAVAHAHGNAWVHKLTLVKAPLRRNVV